MFSEWSNWVICWWDGKMVCYGLIKNESVKNSTADTLKIRTQEWFIIWLKHEWFDLHLHSTLVLFNPRICSLCKCQPMCVVRKLVYGSLMLRIQVRILKRPRVAVGTWLINMIAFVQFIPVVLLKLYRYVISLSSIPHSTFFSRN